MTVKIIFEIGSRIIIYDQKEKIIFYCIPVYYLFF